MSAILVLGEPGSGKSAAIENLDPATTVILKPNAKALPFLGSKTKYVDKKNSFILKTFKGVGDTIKSINDNAKNIKTIVLEDFTHYMTKDVIDKAGEKGYEKWTNLAVQIFKQIVETCVVDGLRPDLDFVFIAHVSATADAAGNMEIGMSTAGKLLDNVIKIPSYFTYIFHAVVDFAGDEPTYQFQTNRDNVRMAKTPKGCFPFLIPNDYKAIFERIHDYEAGTAKPLE